MKNLIPINYNTISVGLFFTLIFVLMIPAFGQMRNVFSVDGFDPHAHCFAWNQPILRMYIVSDSLIGVSYMGIASMLMYLYYRFRDFLPLPWVLLAFSAFIFSCGITHFMDVWTLWNPTYRLSAYAKFVTGVVSAGTALILPPLIPRFLGIVNEAKISGQRRQDLVKTNYQLQAEIEKHRQTLHALQQSEAQLRTVINNAPVVLSTIDKAGIVEMVEGNALRRVKFPLKELVGKPITAIAEEDIAVSDAIQIALNGQETAILIQQERVSFENRFSPILDDDEQIIGVIGVSVDVSERIKAEDDLRHAYKKERELNELRERFVARMSHEFRTPLAIINSSMEMLYRYYERMTTEQRNERATRVQTEIMNLTRMLDDVLLIGKVEADDLEYRPTQFDIVELCRATTDDLNHMQDKIMVKFSSTLETLPVKLDQQLMIYIINNLINNAIKYSEMGAVVEITLRLNDNNTQLILAVKDSGIGIPANNQQHIFDRFYRGDNIEGIAGTGLGLSIVKRAIDLHNGTITFESEENVGTTFIVHLPTNMPSSEEE